MSSSRRSTAPALVCFFAPMFVAPAVHAADASSLTVAVAWPGADSFAGNSLPIWVNVDPKESVTRVEARIGTQLGTLEQVNFQTLPSWMGTIVIQSLPRGPQTLTVTAYDADQNSATASQIFVHDNPPVITIASPLDLAAVDSGLHVVASCTDDDPDVGCRTFTVRAGTVSMTGASAIDSVLDLAAYKGTSVELTFSATDSLDQTTTVKRRVFVGDTPSFDTILKVDGIVLDFDGSRALYRRPNTDEIILLVPGSPELTIGTAHDGIVRDDANCGPRITEHPKGWLTSTGAAWFSFPISTLLVAFDWRGGQKAIFFQGDPLGHTTTVGFFAAPIPYIKGDYAVWGRPWFMQNSSVTLRNLATGLNVEIPSPFSDGGGQSLLGYFGLDPAGNFVAFANLSGTGGPRALASVFRYEAARFTPSDTVMYCGDECGLDLPGLITVNDGTNVIYNGWTGDIDGGSCQVSLLDRNGLTTPLAEQGPQAFPGQGYYDANDGWTAFLRKDASGIQQPWIRAPSGMQTQLACLTQDGSIDAVNSVGEVMFTSAGRRYLAAPGSALARVALASGFAVARLGNWYVIADGVVVRVGRVETDSGTACAPPTRDGGEADGASDGPVEGAAIADAGNVADDPGIRDGSGTSDVGTDRDVGSNANVGSSSCGCRLPTQPAAHLSPWPWLAALLVMRRRMGRATGMQAIRCV